MRLLALAGLVAAAACTREPAFLPEYPAFDLLIENGRVVDGSGAPARVADVVVVGDTIVFVGDVPRVDDERVARVVDAAGRVVTPGFIDLHAHGDPLETPAFENFLAMGVTTITLGQDGSSPEVPDLAAWLAEVAERGIGTNLAMFVGHGTLRTQLGIGRRARPEPEELERFRQTLDEILDYTFGMSTGLEYSPGLYAGREELVALAEVVGRHDRIVMSHMRNEDDDALEASIAELLDQGRHARVHIAHLKSVYGKGAQRAREITALIEAARAEGIELTADSYPYSASYTSIAILFPDWAKTREQFDVARATRREELADYLRNRVMLRNGPEATLLGTEPWTGRTLAEISNELERPFEEVLIDVIGPDGASAAYFVMNDALQVALLDSPWVGICSDGSPTGSHPRGHGTFAKIIEDYVVRDGRLSLEQAVAKMTGFAADVLRLPDRGRIAEGLRADLLVFDPAAVRAHATYPEPLQFASGFDLVVVNGRVAREDGRLAPVRAGRVLRPVAP